MATTLSNLRAYARAEMKNMDPNGKVWDDAAMDRAVNDGYRMVQKMGAYAWPANQATGTVAVVAGTQEHDLPTDFVSLRAVRATSWNLSLGYKEDFFNRSQSQGVPFAYYLEGSKLGLYPIPASGDTLQLLYNKRLATLTSVQDSQFSEAYDTAVAKAAAYSILSGSPRFAREAQNKLAELQTEIATLTMQDRFRDRNATANAR
jgi:hypothetical protein